MTSSMVDSALINALIRQEETHWFPRSLPAAEQALEHVGLNAQDSYDALQRLNRFGPYLAHVFPETKPDKGIIESPIQDILSMKSSLEQHYGHKLSGRLMIKMDNALPISGSIKARGGVYEVLVHAEKLAIEQGLINLSDDYAKLASPECRQFFSNYSIAVGSTGNLGLSIGIISAKLGFDVTVHMSSEAKQWKKDKLKQQGVNVVEYDADYSIAVSNGRRQAEAQPNCFFIDDENSTTLFLGYSVAGHRLKAQLERHQIHVDRHHPLFVYLPCGVGGGPGGVAFGLKLAFGDHVHCFFAEPTESPCMMLGVYTGLHDGICVQDIGLNNQTVADGLAVGRASGFVGRAMERLISGYYTVKDSTLLSHLKRLKATEGIALEPSALAGMKGPFIISGHSAYASQHHLTEQQFSNATHLVWATGGGMVPEQEMRQYLSE
ncbi:D-serine ammonia-lyase [Vibrio ostreicida]|uniref:D-serine ammonia-lyase n=1 Tax=Vibrio ostreicida TaxID=526588 RepID=UPI000970427A|nr:D-serine ammonia-lyase [Vibrio ostreicida]